MTPKAKAVLEKLKAAIDSGTKGLSDEDYVEVLEEVEADCEAKSSAKREELESDEDL